MTRFRNSNQAFFLKPTNLALASRETARRQVPKQGVTSTVVLMPSLKTFRFPLQTFHKLIVVTTEERPGPLVDLTASLAEMSPHEHRLLSLSIETLDNYPIGDVLFFSPSLLCHPIRLQPPPFDRFHLSIKHANDTVRTLLLLHDPNQNLFTNLRASTGTTLAHARSALRTRIQTSRTSRNSLVSCAPAPATRAHLPMHWLGSHEEGRVHIAQLV